MLVRAAIIPQPMSTPTAAGIDRHGGNHRSPPSRPCPSERRAWHGEPLVDEGERREVLELLERRFLNVVRPRSSPERSLHL